MLCDILTFFCVDPAEGGEEYWSVPTQLHRNCSKHETGTKKRRTKREVEREKREERRKVNY